MSNVSPHASDSSPATWSDRLNVVVAAETIQATPGLAKLLAKDSSIPFVFCSANSRELPAICRQVKPCVLIAEMSFINTINSAILMGKNASQDSIKFLAVVDGDDPELCKRLLKLGYSGAIQRMAPPMVYLRALRAVVGGELWASRGTVASLVRELLLADHQPKLTEREKQILDLIVAGHPNRQIANLLFISHETVRWHLRAIYKKLGVCDRNHAIAFAQHLTESALTKPVQRAVSFRKALTIPTTQD